MSFASLVQSLRPGLPAYLDLARWELLRLSKDDVVFHMNPAAPADALDLARGLRDGPLAPRILAYALSRTLAEGPKLFTFPALACEALEHFDLSIDCRDYLQPFPSVVVELPRDYAAERALPWALGSHAPDFIVARHEKALGLILLVVYMNSGTSTTRVLPAFGGPGRTLEGAWQESARRFQDLATSRESPPTHPPTQLSEMDGLPLTPGEEALVAGLGKLALNTCLFATAYGTHSLGPVNPSHFHRLQRQADLPAPPHSPKRRATLADLVSCPLRFDFARTVTLFRKEAIPHAYSPSPDGRTVSPHWRRGHWRNQSYGPYHSLRKRIAVPAVLVNARLFLGQPSDTTTTYRLGPSTHVGNSLEA